MVYENDIELAAQMGWQCLSTLFLYPEPRSSVSVLTYFTYITPFSLDFVTTPGGHTSFAPSGSLRLYSYAVSSTVTYFLLHCCCCGARPRPQPTALLSVAEVPINSTLLYRFAYLGGGHGISENPRCSWQLHFVGL